MTAVIWGDLVKSQVDDETIEEAIARITQQHDDDADSHLDAGQSLNSHKAEAIIDHVASSIVTDKLASGAVTAPKMDTAGKVADCVVAASGGDYTTIGAALTAGKKVIFIKKGTYVLSADIELTSGVVLIGEDKYSTIIDFNSGAYGIKILGSSGNNVVGVVIKGLTIKDSTASGAVFGDYLDDIHINDCIFIDNTQNINFATTGNYCGEVFVEKNEFRGDGTIDIGTSDADAARAVYVRNNRFYDVNPNAIYIAGDNVQLFAYIEDNIISFTSQQTSSYAIYSELGNVEGNFISNAYVGVDGGSISILGNQIYDSRQYAINVSGDGCVITNNQIMGVSGGTNQRGIMVGGYQHNVISNNQIYDAVGVGIYINGSDYSSISGNVLNNCGNNIYITAGSYYNIILGNMCYDCGLTLTDLGVDNEISHNKLIVP